jgi:hypothetical protein
MRERMKKGEIMTDGWKLLTFGLFIPASVFIWSAVAWHSPGISCIVSIFAALLGRIVYEFVPEKD